MKHNLNEQIFGNIIRGYSKSKFRGAKIFFKHFGILDSSDVSAVYEESFNKAIEIGVPTEAEAEERAFEDGTWSEEQNVEISHLENEIHQLNVAKAKLLSSSQIAAQNETIRDRKQKLHAKKETRHSLLGKTAESFAQRRANEFFVYRSSFLKEDFSKKIMSRRDFEECETAYLSDLIDCYGECSRYLTSDYIKKIAVSPMCINLIAICNDAPATFYGKPVTALSYVQVELLNFTRYYFSILTNAENEIPKDVKEDPEALEEWYNSQKNAKEHLEKSGRHKHDGRQLTSFVGKNKKDLDYMGAGKGAKPMQLASKIKQMGGMNLNQIANL